MRYLFGNYVLDLQRYELHGAGGLIKLRRKVFQVLAYLLAHRHRVVSKHELFTHVWPDQFVGEATLTSCITTLRKTLGDDGRTPRFVRTLHGQGYRFVAAVEVQEPLPADTAPHAPTLPGEREGGSGDEASTRADLSHPVQPLPEEALALHEAPLPLAMPLNVEHKQVTVLCGALVEAPALAARLGPEAMYHLMHDVLTLAQETVQRYGGTFLQVSGEGFLALFGAPVAQEDHARRAVLAALDLRQRLRVPEALRGQPQVVALRLGLHSGPVVVGPLVHDPQRPYTAVGDTLALATRLQQKAAPDTVLVSAGTYALVQAEVQGEAWTAGPSTASSPLTSAYSVHGFLRRRAGVPWRGGRLRSRFVGRTRELALLHERLALVASRQGQAVGLVGEPGIGKSRLLAEFAHSLDGQSVTYCEGYCLAYGSVTPYLPLRDLLRQLWGLPDTDTPDALIATLQQQMHKAGIVSEEECLLLRQLLDVGREAEALAALSPEVRRARTFALLWQLVLHASQHQPLVLAVEDLHWSDPTSEEWLTALAARVGGAPILLLATYRPGYRLPWLTHSWATQVALPPLTPADSLVVVQAVPQAAQLPACQHQAIVIKASGNPFFVEELALAAVARDDQSRPLPLPDTIQAVLAARLDRLPPETKRLVQIAAVIGPEVPVSLLQRVAGLEKDALHGGLAHLQEVELLYETRLVPEQVYTFRHALTHEVAYSSLLQEQRRVLHARIVEALEALAGDQVAGQVERRAYHALRGEIWDKAVTYGQQVGARAYDRAAFREAAVYVEQALQALGHLPESGDTRGLACDLRLALRNSLVPLGEYGRGLALLSEAETLARARDDRARLGRVLAMMGQTCRLMGDYDSAMAAGRQACALAAALGKHALQVEASYRLGQTYYDGGDFGQAAELQQWSVEVMDRASDTCPAHMRSQARARLARTLGALGAFAEGRRYGEEALRLATLDSRGQTPVIAHACLGELYLAQGDLTHAVQVLEQSLTLCRVSSDQTWLRGIMAGLASAYALQGRLAEGRALVEEAASESLGTGPHPKVFLTRLSEACRLAGRNEEAWQHARQALHLARQQKARGREAHALHQLGAVHAHADPPNVAQAEAYYQQALALAEELGMRPLQAHCHLGLGSLYASTDRRELTRAELSTAIDLYHAMDMTFWLPQAKAVLAQVE
jgi:class 3 adenylate cyclase/tetratricopeptide (TPR) repeat protein